MTNQIDPTTLHKLVETNTVRVIDSSWALDGMDMQSLYRKAHIPGAVFFDIEEIRDHSSPLPHMAPSPDSFAESVGRLGIGHDDHVVVYDQQGLFSSARVWWLFKQMGHKNIQILRGGLPAWKLLHLPVTGEASMPSPTAYRIDQIQNFSITLSALREDAKAASPVIILDARSQARFEGTVPEPRAGLRSGHMPGARNLPFNELIHDGVLKPRAELEAIFCAIGLAEGQRVVTTCGSGVTAAIISLALAEIGHTPALLYDGSWAEWGQESLDTPVAKITDK